MGNTFITTKRPGAQFQKHPEEIIGKTDEEIWPAEDAARYRENDAAVIEGGRPVEFLEPVAHPDGPHSWLIYKFPIVEDGKVALVGGIGIDITERQDSGRATHPGAQDGGARPSCRRRRARFQ